MNGQGLKAVAFQISPVGPCIALKFSGELLGVTHSAKILGKLAHRDPGYVGGTQRFTIEILQNHQTHALGDPDKLSRKFECDTRCYG